MSKFGKKEETGNRQKTGNDDIVIWGHKMPEGLCIIQDIFS